MDFSPALPTFVITLREGVEAALVVGIVLALLKKTNRADLKPWVGVGVGAGLVGSVVVGSLLGLLLQGLGSSPYGPVLEPMLEGVFSLCAIGLLSWMLIWMTQQARFLKKQIEEQISTALDQGPLAAWGIVSLIGFAVLREGFETVLFLLANFQQGWIPTLGALGGFGAAVLVGLLIFRWGVRLDVRLFFQTMGTFLLLIVAGLGVTALQHFDDAMKVLASTTRQAESYCFFYERFARTPSCILGPQLWDGSAILPQEHFPGVIFHALLGYNEHLYLVQGLMYLGLLFGAGTIYLRSLGLVKPAKSPSETREMSRLQ